MRYILHLSIISYLLFCTELSSAQLVRLGVQVGPTTTDFYDNQQPLVENRWGIPTLGASFGLVGQLSLGRWGQLQVENNVSCESNQGHFWKDEKVNLWYLTTPILMKFKIYPSFWIGGGLESNYLFDVTGTFDVYENKYWNGAVMLQAEHTFLDHFACTIRYLHGFTPVSIVKYVNYEGESGTTATYASKRLSVALSYFFYKHKVESKRVENGTRFY